MAEALTEGDLAVGDEAVDSCAVGIPLLAIHAVCLRG